MENQLPQLVEWGLGAASFAGAGWVLINMLDKLVGFADRLRERKNGSGAYRPVGAGLSLPHCSVEVRQALQQNADTMRDLKELMAQSIGTSTSIGHLLERLVEKANDSDSKLNVLLDRTRGRQGFRGGVKSEP